MMRKNNHRIGTDDDNVYDDEDSEEFYYESTATHLHHREIVSHDEKISTSILPKRQNLRHRHHYRSNTSRIEIKKVPNIDAYQPLTMERPSSAPVLCTNDYRSKNFRVQVYRNGDFSICAYCASCSMDIILSDATRKLQLIRPARRLFDLNGYEIFRREDIQRDTKYCVSYGENFINPWKAINFQTQYRLHSRWTIYGIQSWYTSIRRIQRHIPIKTPKPSNGRPPVLIRTANKQTQTQTQRTICKNKETSMVDDRPSAAYKQTQTEPIKVGTPPGKYKQTQTEQTTRENKETSMLGDKPPPKCEETETEPIKVGTPPGKYQQTQTEQTARENKETSMLGDKPPPKCEETQTEPIKADTPRAEYKQTQTEQTTRENKETSMLGDKPPPKCEETQTEPIKFGTSPGKYQQTQTEPIKVGTLPSKNKETQTESTAPEIKRIQIVTKRESKTTQTERDSRPPPTPIGTLRTTNFRVKVYRNGEHNRYEYCKSCSMDIILSAATQKLQMSIPARRLFDANGREIYHSQEIQRGMEYYVSSGENFKSLLK